MIRVLSAVAAASLLCLAQPTAVHAAPGGGTCKHLLKTPVATTSTNTPSVIYLDDARGGEWNLLWFDDYAPNSHHVRASCAFHDVDRDRRFDPKSELTFVVRETLTSSEFGGRWPETLPLSGVEEGEQVCSRRSTRTQPVSGGKATTKVVDGCFVVTATYPSG